jgi:hypothetical protein
MGTLLTMLSSNTVHSKDRQFHVVLPMPIFKMSLLKEPQETLLKVTMMLLHAEARWTTAVHLCLWPDALRTDAASVLLDG